jgi:hypothetical protein
MIRNVKKWTYPRHVCTYEAETLLVAEVVAEDIRCCLWHHRPRLMRFVEDIRYYLWYRKYMRFLAENIRCWLWHHRSCLIRFVEDIRYYLWYRKYMRFLAGNIQCCLWHHRPRLMCFVEDTQCYLWYRKSWMRFLVEERLAVATRYTGLLRYLKRWGSCSDRKGSSLLTYSRMCLERCCPGRNAEGHYIDTGVGNLVQRMAMEMEEFAYLVFNLAGGY